MVANDSANRARGTALLGFFINIMLVTIKVTAGVLGNSYALIADGVESTADIFSSIIVWSGLTVARREPDEKHPFGYGKAESLAAAAVALMLVAAAVGIALQALREIVTPHHVPAPFTLIVLVVVVVVKELLFRYVVRVGSALGSLAVQTDAWHHRSDALTSVAAFIGISIALLGGQRWAAADDYAALAASVIIAFNGVSFLRPALFDLMDRAPGDVFRREVEKRALEVDGVRAIEKLLARRVGMTFRVVLHVQADPDLTLAAAHEIGHRVRDHICRALPNISDVVVHMEPYSDGPVL